MNESIQKAIYEKLILDTVLMSEVVSIYDSHPQVTDSGVDSDFPYITIGDENVLTWDTDTELGFQSSITVHVWARNRGKKECKLVQGLIYESLHRTDDLVFLDYRVVGIDQESATTFIDSDGSTIHGTQTFNLTIEKVV